MAHLELWPQTISRDSDQRSAPVLEEQDLFFNDREAYEFHERPASSPIVLKSIYGIPPTKDDWQMIRPVFTKLYFTEAKSLKDVMSELANKHGFHGSVKMYKTHITRWHLRRSLNRDEVIQILGIEASRKAQGKETMFWLRGQPVDMDNIHRYQRRKGLKTIDALRQFNLKQAKLCPDLEVGSPPDTSTAVTLLETEHGLERCLFEYRAMLDGMLERQILACLPIGLTIERDHLTSQNKQTINNLMRNILYENFNQTYFLSLRRFSIFLERINESYDPWLILCAVETIARLGLKDLRVAEVMFSHLRSLVRSKQTLAYPSAKLWIALAELGQGKSALCLVKLWEVFLNKQIEVQPSNSSAVGSLFTLDSRARLSAICSILGFPMDKAQVLACLKDCLEPVLYLHPTFLDTLSFVLYLWPELREENEIAEYLVWVSDSAKFSIEEKGVSFAGCLLDFETAFRLTRIYNRIGDLALQRNLQQLLFKCYEAYRLSDDDLWQVLDDLDWLSTRSDVADGNVRWRELMTDIEDEWLAEVEAATPDDSLSNACQY